MQLAPGSSVLHYRVAAFLGRGGMGAVYRAQDTKLGRDVAIKVLPPEFGEDDERLGRFDREARLLAAMNHPHIATIHGIEHVDGMRFIVMEHVIGETLSERLTRGEMPIEEAIAVGKQIAAALEAAHEKGVIHRDLKPGNIIIDDEGRVKVLDFGLASNIGPDSIETEIANSPTTPHVGTHTGVILGTAGYMSPEQARGKKVDRRADVFAFGVVLFEMLTGRRAFIGETVSDTLAAVLKEEPNWNALPAATPPSLRRLLRRCLAKKQSDRMRDFGDIRLELEEIDDAPQTAPKVARPSVLPWIVAAVAIAAGAAGLWRAKSAAVPRRVIKTVVSSQLDNAWNIFPAISPDGTRVAYAADGSLWIRTLAELEPRKIPLTGRRQPVLFWSPDSNWVVFISGEKIWKIAPGGSAPIPIASLPTTAGGGSMVFHSGAWGADDRIVLAGYREGLYELSARGGSVTELIAADSTLVDFHNISFLPDGKTLLAVPHGMMIRETVEVIRDKKRQTVVTFPNSVIRGAAYSPTGHLLVSVFGSEAGLWAVPFSLEKMATTGKPFIALAGAGGCTTASDGSIVFVSNIDYTPRQLVRIDRSGMIATKIGEPIDSLSSPAASHDESMIAIAARNEGSLSVELMDAATASRRPITRGGFEDRPIAWSRDDHRLMLHRDPNGKWADPQFGIWLYPLDGTSDPRHIVNGASGTFTPDEKHIVYMQPEPRDRMNMAVAAVDGGQPVEFIKSRLSGAPREWRTVAVSPDGRLVAYSSSESGVTEIFVASYPDGQTKRQISRGGAAIPQWSRDGQRLYFASGSKLMSVNPREATPMPSLVFDVARLGVTLTNGFDILRDGSVIATQDLPNDKRQVVLVQNWAEEFH